MRISDWSSDVCSSDLINYEICVLTALRERLRCKEIWVVGADRYRNPDDDLPRDFETRRADYYRELGRSEDAGAFVTGLRAQMAEALGARSEERRVGKECVSRVDLGGRRIIKTKRNPQSRARNKIKL